MMRFICIVIIAALLIFLNNCNDGGGGNAANSEIEKRDGKIYPLTLKKEKEARIDVISSRSSMVLANIDDPNYLYVYIVWNENKDCEIIKLSNELEVVRKGIIKYGIGPGESRNTVIIGGNQNSIIAYDMPGQKFIILDSELRIVKEIKKNRGLELSALIFGHYLVKNSSCIFGFSNRLGHSREQGTTKHDIGVAVKKYNLNYDYNKRILYKEPFTERYREDYTSIGSGPLLFTYCFEHIYILIKREYRIIKMDLDGRIIKEKRFAFEPKTFSKSVLEKWIRQTYGKKYSKNFAYDETLLPTNWMMPIADGIAVGIIDNHDPEDKGPVYADFFDRDLNYRGKITVPYFHRWNVPAAGQLKVVCSFLSRNNKLYQLQETEMEEGTEFKLIIWGSKNDKN